MKTFVMLFLSLLMSSVCLADAQIANPGFESMATNPSSGVLEPGNWTLYAQSNATVYFAAKTDVVRTGTYSEKIAARNGYGMIYQEISSGFSAGETYSFWMYGRGDTNSGWIMDETGDQVDLYIKFKDAGGNQIGDEISMILFDTDPATQAPILSSVEWVQSPVFQFTIPDGTTSFLVKIRSVDGSEDGGKVDGTSIYMDDIMLDVLPLPAKNPLPSDKAIEQPVTGLSLSWEPGDDPYAAGVPNGDITGYYLSVEIYDITNDPGEPNSINDPNYVESAPVELSTAEYTSENIEIGFDKIVFWKVDQSINGSSVDGLATVKGKWWSFYTETSFPVIKTQPQDVSILEGQTATISIEADDDSNSIVLYEWYDSDDVLIASGEDATAIVFESATTSDAGEYYCVLTNSQGKQTVSDVAVLMVKGLLLKYDFENDLTDATGNFDGTGTTLDPGGELGITYETAGIDGIAAVFDGTSYMDLGIEAYPNKEQGLKSGTLSFWVKKNDDITSTVIAVYNDSLVTCYNLSLQESGRIYFYIRAESGAFTTVQTTAEGLFDGQWHQIVATYEAGSNTNVYLDGEIIGSSTGLGENEVFADWSYSMVVGAGNTRGLINNVYTGSLDAFALYNYPMTNKEVLDMYNDLAPVKKSLCLDSYASAYDIAGPEGEGIPDCEVNIYDLAVIANAWLECGLYPACVK